MKPSKGKAMTTAKTPMKTKAELPKDNFMEKYAKYADCKELYVMNTINKDIVSMQDKKRFEAHQAAVKEKNRKQDLLVKGQLKKMTDIFDAYYDLKLKGEATQIARSNKAKQLKMDIKPSNKGQRDDSYSQSPDRGSPDNRKKSKARSNSKTRSSSKKRPKKMARAQSARPSGPKKIVKLSPLSSIEGLKQRAELWSIDMRLLEKDATFKKIYNELNSERRIVEAVMNTLVRRNKLTNEEQTIFSCFRRYKGEIVDSSGRSLQDGDEVVDSAIRNFFDIDNTALRLVAYKEVVNKCKRYANVPLYQFYVQMQKAEKVVFMVDKSANKRKIILQPEEIITLPGYDHPKKEMYEEEYMCHRYSLKFKRDQEATKNAEKKVK
jgi:hypothetical protein